MPPKVVKDSGAPLDDVDVDNSMNITKLLSILNKMLELPPVKLNVDTERYIIQVPDILQDYDNLSDDNVKLLVWMHLKCYINPLLKTKVDEAKARALKEIKGCYLDVDLSDDKKSVRFYSESLTKSGFEFVFV